MSIPRGRGRPKKITTDNPQYVKISTKSSPIPKKKGTSLFDLETEGYHNNKIVEGDQPVRQKRKYTRRKPISYNKTDDDTIIKPEAKKRGRKRGRKKKEEYLLFKPEEVIDFVHRNFPLMGIDRIRDKVIDGLKIMREFGDSPYLLYKFTYDDTIYYYDNEGAILNTDGKLVGYFVKQKDGNNKMYMFKRKNKDIRTFQEVIDSIERLDTN
jgi:hypothetical protein